MPVCSLSGIVLLHCWSCVCKGLEWCGWGQAGSHPHTWLSDHRSDWWNVSDKQAWSSRELLWSRYADPDMNHDLGLIRQIL